MSLHPIPPPAAPGVASAAPEVGRGLARAAAEAWTREDTEAWLTDYPLPATFVWNGTRAYPTYRLKKGYGQWLRTAGPYHAALRGLFVLCHELLASLRPGIDPMPTQEQLAAMCLRHAGRQLTLSAEDLAPPEAQNPAENVPAPASAGSSAPAGAPSAASADESEYLRPADEADEDEAVPF